MLDTRIQRLLEEIIYEKHDETKRLKKKVADLEKQCSEYGSDALQTSFQLDAANELLEREHRELLELANSEQKLKNHVAELEDENKRLKAQVKELQSAKIDAGNAYVDHLFKVIAQERTEREYREKQVAELQGRLAKLQHIIDDEFP
jgi:chromosome segregation ATPase